RADAPGDARRDGDCLRERPPVTDLLIDLVASVAGGFQAFFDRSIGFVVRDCVDILMVATLFYLVLSVIKGTRAMQMAIGVALVMGAYFFVQRLGLITIWTLLDSILTYIVIIIVVIFQNDIRRGLMRVVSWTLFKSQRSAKETAVIEEVIKAASALAQKRIGALIVFE